MQNSEALFFVDHDQTEVSEANIIGNETVRPDDDATHLRE